MERPRRRLKDGMLYDIYWTRCCSESKGSGGNRFKRIAELMLLHKHGKQMGKDFLKQYSKLSMDRRSRQLSLPDDKEKEYTVRGQIVPPSLSVSEKEAYCLTRLELVTVKELALLCGSYQYFKNVTFAGLETIEFANGSCGTNDCDHAWVLCVLQNSAETLKTLKNLPRWLVPCPEPLRSFLNLQQLSLWDVSSFPDEALILPRTKKLQFSTPWSRRMRFNTETIRFIPRFALALDVSDIEYDAELVKLDKFGLPDPNDFQARKMCVKKFSAKLKTYASGSDAKLAELISVLPRYFPSLEVLELNVKAEKTLDHRVLDPDEGANELTEFVASVNRKTAFVESTLRNCTSSCEIDVRYSMRLDCVYDSDPFPYISIDSCADPPQLDKFPGFAIDQPSIDQYETEEEIDRPPADEAVCFVKKTQISDVRKLTMRCQICRYASGEYGHDAGSDG